MLRKKEVSVRLVQQFVLFFPHQAHRSNTVFSFLSAFIFTDERKTCPALHKRGSGLSDASAEYPHTHLRSQFMSQSKYFSPAAVKVFQVLPAGHPLHQNTLSESVFAYTGHILPWRPPPCTRVFAEAGEVKHTGLCLHSVCVDSDGCRLERGQNVFDGWIDTWISCLRRFLPLSSVKTFT